MQINVDENETWGRNEIQFLLTFANAIIFGACVICQNIHIAYCMEFYKLQQCLWFYSDCAFIAYFTRVAYYNKFACKATWMHINKFHKAGIFCKTD